MTLLTRRQALAVGKPAGFALLAAFLDEVDRGEIPRDAETLALGKAFDAILKGAEPMAALGLKRRRGQPSGPARATRQRDARICDYIGRRLESDTKRGKMARVYRDAKKRFPRDTGLIQKIWLKGKAAWQQDRALEVAASRLARTATAPLNLAPMRHMRRVVQERIRLERELGKLVPVANAATRLADAANAVARLGNATKPRRRTTKV